MTGLADAFLDSVPLVAITGQVASSHIGTDAFQEMDVIGMSLSCTKHSYLVTDINELAPTLAEAFEVAQTGRPGPVLVDIAKDVQLGKAPVSALPSFTPPAMPHVDATHLANAQALLAQSKRLYCMWVEVYNWRMPQTQCVSFTPQSYAFSEHTQRLGHHRASRPTLSWHARHARHQSGKLNRTRV